MTNGGSSPVFMPVVNDRPEAGRAELSQPNPAELELSSNESNQIKSNRRGVSKLLWVFSLVEQQVEIRGAGGEMWTYPCPWPRYLLFSPFAPFPPQAQLPLGSNLLLLGNKLKFSSARFDLRSVTLAFRLTSLVERKLVCAHPASNTSPPSRPYLPSDNPLGLLTSVASPSARERCPGSSSHSRSVCSDESREISKISIER